MPVKSSDEEYLKELLAYLGVVQALRDDPNDFRKVVIRLWTGTRLLTRSHPNKDGQRWLISIGDSIEEAVVPLRQKASAPPM